MLNELVHCLRRNVNRSGIGLHCLHWLERSRLNHRANVHCNDTLMFMNSEGNPDVSVYLTSQQTRGIQCCFNVRSASKYYLIMPLLNRHLLSYHPCLAWCSPPPPRLDIVQWNDNELIDDDTTNNFQSPCSVWEQDYLWPMLLKSSFYRLLNCSKCTLLTHKWL